MRLYTTITWASIIDSAVHRKSPRLSASIVEKTDSGFQLNCGDSRPCLETVAFFVSRFFVYRLSFSLIAFEGTYVADRPGCIAQRRDRCGIRSLAARVLAAALYGLVCAREHAPR